MEGREPRALAQGALLVGSVPLSTSEEVFRLAARRLGRHLLRIPDGETGDRKLWIAGQLALFQGMRELEPEVVDIGYLKRAKFRLKPDSGNVAFPSLGYAAAAVQSYKVFKKLKGEGVIRPSVKLQVGLPTPLAALHAYLFPESMAALTEPYEGRMRAELEEILAAVPHAELAIQWDTAIEFAVLEGVMPSVFTEQQLMEKLVAYGRWVPPGVDLGFHLCYGDSGHKHFKEPRDTALLVRVANVLLEALPVRWIHLPVPRERTDDAYFAPLKHLRPVEELYLGLVHMTDGEAGARRRMETASKYVKAFGVSTECGFGRRPPETVGPLMDLHAALLQ